MYKLENRGGRRLGSGRKPKADELKLVEKLDNVIDNDIALKKLDTRQTKIVMKC